MEFSVDEFGTHAGDEGLGFRGLGFRVWGSRLEMEFTCAALNPKPRTLGGGARDGRSQGAN